MRTSCRDVTNRTGWVVALLFLASVHTASAITYMSVEPVPNVNIVGEADLATIRSIGYANLERWSQRLLNERRAQNRAPVADAGPALSLRYSEQFDFEDGGPLPFHLSSESRFSSSHATMAAQQRPESSTSSVFSIPSRPALTR